MHGVSIVTLILVVPTFIAATVLLIKDAKTGVLLGVGFAVLWIGLGLGSPLFANCSAKDTQCNNTTNDSDRRF